MGRSRQDRLIILALHTIAAAGFFLITMEAVGFLTGAGQ